MVYVTEANMLHFGWIRNLLAFFLLLKCSMVRSQTQEAPANQNSYYRVVQDIRNRDTANLYSSIIPVLNHTHPLDVEMSVAMTQIIQVNEYTQVCALYTKFGASK